MSIITDDNRNIEKDLYLAIVLLNLYDYRLKMYTLLYKMVEKDSVLCNTELNPLDSLFV